MFVLGRATRNISMSAHSLVPTSLLSRCQVACRGDDSNQRAKTHFLRYGQQCCLACSFFLCFYLPFLFSFWLQYKLSKSHVVHWLISCLSTKLRPHGIIKPRSTRPLHSYPNLICNNGRHYLSRLHALVISVDSSSSLLKPFFLL